MSLLQRLLLAVFLLTAMTLPARAYDKAVVEDTIAGQEAIAGLNRHEISIDGHKLFYLDNDKTQAARTVLFLHDFGDSSLSWLFFARVFRDADYRIIVPDQLGFGRSPRPVDADYGYAAQAKRMLSLLQALKVQKVHLIGNSMGGGIAAKMTLLQPELVSSLTLMAASGVHYKTSDMDKLVVMGNNPLVINKQDDFDALIDFATYRRPLLTRPVVEFLGERAMKDRALHLRIFNEVLVEDLDFLMLDLPDLKPPTLVLWGEKDRVLHPDNARLFQRYVPGVRVRTFADVGHMPMVEIPEVSANAVMEFIDAVAPVAAASAAAK